jgi:hypothetical protein
MRRLPAVLRGHDQATNVYATERARGAAEALRQLKRDILMPDSARWDRVAAVVTKDVIALATGDLRDLAWKRPPTPAQVRRSRWKVAGGTVRTLALAALPLVLVLVTRPVLHLDASVSGWAEIVGIAWAALYLLATLDPTLRDKLDTARSAVGIFRDVRSSTVQERPAPVQER